MDQSTGALQVADDRAADMRLHEAHHRIANDLAVIASMVRLQAQALQAKTISAEDARNMLLDAAGRVDAVGRLHRSLCYAVDGRAGREFLSSLCKDAASFAGVEGARVSCRVELRYELSPERLRSLGLLVHELVLNALKYAHPTNMPGNIDVWCRDDEEGRLLVDVADDGVGLPEGFSPESDGGFGFRMMRELARQLDAVLVFDSSPLGLTCQVRGRRTHA